jgi:hypothetical protein
MHTDTRDRRPYAAELKFLVSPDVGDAIRTWARAHLTADPHGSGPHADQYTTTTLYTDTPGQDVYHRQGSYGRSKYRVRRYGSSDVVFLERKLRTKSLLSKRRSSIPLEELARLEGPASPDAPWIGEWFMGRLAARRLSPVCQVTYGRTARVTQTPYGLARLTVDDGLAARPVTGWAYDPPVYEPALVGQQIVELKYIVAMPAVFKRLVETFSLEPMTVSKYRLSVAALGAVKEMA